MDKVRQGKSIIAMSQVLHPLRAAVTTLSPQGSHRQPEVNYSSQSTSLGLSFCKEGQLEAFETSQIMMHLVASGATCGIINPS